MSDDNKKKINYGPDIRYNEDYYSDGLYIDNVSNNNIDYDDNDDDDIYDNAIMDTIQGNIDHLVKVIPLLPIDLQTVVNQVFKPIFNDWYTNLKGNNYPKYIPNPDGVTIKPITGTLPPNKGKPSKPGTGGTSPGGGGGDPGNGGGGGGGPSSTTTNHVPWVPTPSAPEKEDPIIYIPGVTPDTVDPIVIEKTYITVPVIDGEEMEFSSPFEIEYEEVDPVELAKMEYVKNSADLYSYYTQQLKNTLDRFVYTLLNSIIASNKATGRQDSENYLLSNLSLADVGMTPDDARHLLDLAIRGEVNGQFKMNYCLNVFSLENTLYHLKNYKASKELRLRYEEQEMKADGTNDGSKSDRMLSGLRQQYDKNYDTSYINLYKYLNSSTVLLEDTLSTLLLAVASKEILFKKKGGTEE